MSRLSLEKIIGKAREELRRIQRSDGKTKKRYLAALSSLAMIIVVGLWFSYLNVTLPQSAEEETAAVPGDAVAAREENDTSFFETIGRGAKKIFGDLENQFTKFKENLSQVKEFTVEGGSPGFAPAEPLKPTPLP